MTHVGSFGLGKIYICLIDKGLVIVDRKTDVEPLQECLQTLEKNSSICLKCRFANPSNDLK